MPLLWKWHPTILCMVKHAEQCIKWLSRAVEGCKNNTTNWPLQFSPFILRTYLQSSIWLGMEENGAKQLQSPIAISGLLRHEALTCQLVLQLVAVYIVSLLPRQIMHDADVCFALNTEQIMQFCWNCQSESVFLASQFDPRLGTLLVRDMAATLRCLLWSK